MKNILLLVTDSNGQTVLHVAASYGKLVEMKKLWEWAKEDLTTDEIKNNLLLDTDSNGQTAWHESAKVG
jgi:ankyrin repeat protein